MGNDKNQWVTKYLKHKWNNSYYSQKRDRDSHHYINYSRSSTQCNKTDNQTKNETTCHSL